MPEPGFKEKADWQFFSAHIDEGSQTISCRYSSKLTVIFLVCPESRETLQNKAFGRSSQT
jgi:hypothetical protein